MKRPLQVGDRVRIYGNSQTGLNPLVRNGRIQAICTPDPRGDWYNIKLGLDTYTFHEKQIRRLVPKKKPTECHKLPTKKELETWWAYALDTINGPSCPSFKELCKLIYGEEKK